MSDLVQYRASEGIATFTLCAPPRNTYSYEMMLAFDEAILRARMADDVHVIVVRGAGDKFFCAGADIQMLRTASPRFKYYFCLHANETLCRLEQTPKLVIAAINGHCVGGGLEVAMACDLRVAKESALQLGLPEVTLGVLPGTGGTQRLGRLLGRSKAIELMALGRNFSVKEAHSLGLVHERFPEAEFDAQVITYAQRFVPPNKAAKAVGALKRAVVSGLEGSLHEGLALERELQQQLFVSDDAREGLAAFAEKRPPQFRGS